MLTAFPGMFSSVLRPDLPGSGTVWIAAQDALASFSYRSAARSTYISASTNSSQSPGWLPRELYCQPRVVTPGRIQVSPRVTRL